MTWGQTYIKSHEAAILLAAAPVFVVVLAHFMTRDEKMTVAKLAGVLIGVVGVAVLVDPRRASQWLGIVPRRGDAARHGPFLCLRPASSRD